METTSQTIVSETQEALSKKLKVTPKVPMGEVELRLELDELDEFHVEKARIELREEPEIVKEGFRKLIELLEDTPELNVPTDEEYLCKFLRPCKWYPQSAFELIKRYYGYRISHPRICKDLVPSKTQLVFAYGVLTPLPSRCNDGARVLLLEGGRKWNPTKVPLEDCLRGIMLALEAAMAEPKTQVSGSRVILDMDGLSLSHVTYFTPSFASAVLEWIQKCVPCRLKGVHVINQPYIFNLVFAIFKPFFQEKLRKRVHFHGTDRASLLTHIDAKALPTRYGGNLKLPDEPFGQALLEYFCAFEDEFQVSDKFGYTS